MRIGCGGTTCIRSSVLAFAALVCYPLDLFKVESDTAVAAHNVRSLFAEVVERHDAVGCDVVGQDKTVFPRLYGGRVIVQAARAM